MSVLIKGIEMPQNSEGCEVIIRIQPNGEVLDLNGFHIGATAIPIPPHGRLIDADAPIEVWEVKLSDGDSCSFRNIETTVSKFLLSHLMGEVPPTIIPAEEGE